MSIIYPAIIFFIISSSCIYGELLIISPQTISTAWQYPKGALHLENDQLKLVRANKNTNPFRNSSLRFVGSNLKNAPRVIDGNKRTGWQPDSTDPKKWWIEIDLGQVLPIQQLKFYFDSSKPPLSFFTVSLSKGENFINNANVIVEGTLIYNHRKIFSRNKDHVIDIKLEDQLVKVVKITSDRYDGQKPILLEIEGKATGDNIARNLISRGGSVNVEAEIVAVAGTPTVMFDGSLSTMWRVNPLAKGSSGGSETFGDYRIDLGAVYPIDCIWLLGEPLGVPPRLRHFYANFLSYKIFFSDGSLRPDGTLSWTELISVPSNPNNLLSKRNFDHEFDQFTARYLRLLYPTSQGGNIIGGGLSANSVRLDGLGLVSEFQVFGDGYPAKVKVRSPIIDLKKDFNIRSINWRGTFPQSTQLRMRSRSGNNIIEKKHYYDKNGKEITASRHRKLIPSFRGPIETNLQPGDDWSAWSNDYQNAGSQFKSPSPRRYIQLEMDLFSHKTETSLTLSEVSIEYTAPLVHKAIGEIHPKKAQAGQEEFFTYFLRSISSSSNRGFRQIKLQSSVPLKFITARVNGNFVQTTLNEDDDGFTLTLPNVINENTLIEIDLLATPFQNNTRINSWIELETRESSIQQQIDSGDAVTHINGSGVSIALPVNKNLIANLATDSIITPNGDGINDVIKINFDVLKVSNPRPIIVQIYNLNGEPVRQLLNSLGKSDHYEVVWNGYLSEQTLPTPGLYILKVTVQGDTRNHTMTRLIGVHY